MVDQEVRDRNERSEDAPARDRRPRLGCNVPRAAAQAALPEGVALPIEREDVAATAV
jgi:hypothetical protein